MKFKLILYLQKGNSLGLRFPLTTGTGSFSGSRLVVKSSEDSEPRGMETFAVDTCVALK